MNDVAILPHHAEINFKSKKSARKADFKNTCREVLI